VLKLKELGQNYTELGCETIELIISQMNTRKSSTNPSRDSIVKREVLPLVLDPDYGSNFLFIKRLIFLEIKSKGEGKNR
jgi:hypothetical protein